MRTCENCIHHDVCRYPLEYRANPETCWKYEEPRPKGEWKIYVNLGGTLMRQCMNCGHEFNDNSDAKNFCPNCGADMRKSGEPE